MTVNDEVRPTGETHQLLGSRTGDLWVRGKAGTPPPNHRAGSGWVTPVESTAQLRHKTMVLEEGNLPPVLEVK